MTLGQAKAMEHHPGSSRQDIERLRRGIERKGFQGECSHQGFFRSHTIEDREYQTG